MFALTAAHKHLPLPTYVRVTREDTGASLIVKVNDRGPFHEDRIIDLSYAAARRLGFDQQGTAPVRLEALTFPAPEAVPERGPERVATPKGLWLQAGAFADAAAAQSLLAELEPLLTMADSPAAASIRTDPPPFHRVRIGPFLDARAAARVQALLTFSDLLAVPLLIEE
jgi:rare lipoprotein A